MYQFALGIDLHCRCWKGKEKIALIARWQENLGR